MENSMPRCPRIMTAAAAQVKANAMEKKIRAVE